MKLKIILLLTAASIAFPAFGQVIYPVPAQNENSLFYLQRTHNRNTIIYDLNRLANGNLNIDNPINIYWIRFEENSQKAELSYFQRKAFGLHWKLVDKQKESFVLQFNKFDKRDLILLKTASGKYKVFATINNELAELERAFIQSENNSMGIPLTVQYIELSGISVKSRKKIAEKIKP